MVPKATTPKRRSPSNRLFKIIILAASLFTLGIDPAFAYVTFDWFCENHESGGTCIRHGGLKSIYIFDEIVSKDAIDLAWVDNQLRSEQPFPKVFINSFGGDVQTAEQIGRILRRRKASIEGKNPYSTDHPARCMSACTIIAAGATDRQFDYVGIHRPHGDRSEEYCQLNWVELDSHEIAEFLDYFREMGLSDKFIQYLDKTPSTQMTEFFYDPDSPDDEQMIVQFGFHMHADGPDQPRMFDKQGQPRFLGTRKELESAANNGNAGAALALAKIYEKGERWAAKDMESAVHWYEKAGENGSSSAYHSLGVMFANGSGVKADKKRAKHYYQRAAEYGLAASQNNLGWMYYKGNGVPKDYGLAVYWITRALDQGEGFAYSSFGEMTYYGKGVPQNDIEAYRWLELADNEMPVGAERDANHKLLLKLKARMSESDMRTAQYLSRTWSPLKMTEHPMGPKCKP